MSGPLLSKLHALAAEAESAKRRKETRKREKEIFLKKAMEKRRREIEIEAERAAALERINEEMRLQRETQIERKRQLAIAKRESIRKARLNENARLRRRRKKINDVCQELYKELAIAGWGGKRNVCVKKSYLKYSEDLADAGLVIGDPNKKDAAYLNKNLDKIILILKNINEIISDAEIIATPDTFLTCAEELQSIGYGAIYYHILENVELVINKIEKYLNGIEIAERKLLSSREYSKTICENLKEELLDYEKRRLIDDGRGEDFKSRTLYLVNEIRLNLDSIGVYLSAGLSRLGGSEDSAISSRAEILRSAYSRFIVDTDFSKFSDIEIINLSRISNGKSMLSNVSDLIKEKNFIDKHNALEFEISSIVNVNEKISDLRDSYSDVKKILKKIKNEFIKLKNVCGNVPLIDKIKLINGMDFINGGYVGRVVVSLGRIRAGVSDDFLKFYREIKWIQGRRCKVFRAFLETELYKVGKKGDRTIDVYYFDRDGVGVVRIGRLSHECSINYQLITSILIEQGFSVLRHSDGDNLYKLKISW